MKKLPIIAMCLTMFCGCNVLSQVLNPQQQIENCIISQRFASADQFIDLLIRNSTNRSALSIAWDAWKDNLDALSEEQLYFVYLRQSNIISLVNRNEYQTYLRSGVSKRIMSGILYASNYSQDSTALGKIEYQKQNPEVFKKGYVLSMQANVTNRFIHTSRLNFAITSGQSEDKISSHALDLAKEAIHMRELDYAFKFLNQTAYTKAIKAARAAGRPTVGVVVEEYKNFANSQRTGVGFIEALKVFGWDWPGNWSNEVAQVDQVVSDIYSGEIIKPTEEQLVKIRLYKGSDFLRDFVEKFNKL